MAAATGGQPQSDAKREAEANMNGRSSELLRIGRFEMNVPPGLKVTSRGQSIYGVSVATARLPAGGADAWWGQRRLEIRARANGCGRRRASARIRPAGRRPGHVKRSAAPSFTALEAMRAVSGSAVIASTESASDKQSITETLVRNVLNAYAPGDVPGFAIAEGAIVSEPSVSENVQAALVYEKAADVKMSFATETVAPDTLTHSSLNEETQFVTAQGGCIEKLRDQTRVVAGLAGHEMWISIAIPNQAPFLRFAWTFTGVAVSSTQPMIDVVGSASAAHRVELEAIWSSLLGSVKAIPIARR